MPPRRATRGNPPSARAARAARRGGPDGDGGSGGAGPANAGPGGAGGPVPPLGPTRINLQQGPTPRGFAASAPRYNISSGWAVSQRLAVRPYTELRTRAEAAATAKYATHATRRHNEANAWVDSAGAAAANLSYAQRANAVFRATQNRAAVQGNLGLDITAHPTSIQRADLTAATARAKKNRFYVDFLQHPQLFNSRRITSINVRQWDITPDDITAWYARRRGGVNAGALIVTSAGQPFIVWEQFQRVLGETAFAILNTFAFPKNSWWQLELVNNGGVFANRLMWGKPTLADIIDTLDNFGDGTTSAGTNHTPGNVDDSTYLRVSLYSPGTGSGRTGPVPPHLRGKTHAVWSPFGDHCAPKAIVMCLVRGETPAARSKRDNLKRRDTALNKAIKPLLDNVSSEPAWTYEDLRHTAVFLKVDIVVLSSMTYAVLFDTRDEEEQSTGAAATAAAAAAPTDPIYLLHDQVGQHFMACMRPDALDHNMKWCGKCRKLYWCNSNHVCSAFACRFCKADHASREEFLLHFYGPFDDPKVHTQCDECHKMMPAECLEVHKVKCKAISVRCTECNEYYINADRSKSPHAMTAEQHAEVCGMKYRFCPNCDTHCPPDHQCTITRKSFAHKFGSNKSTVVFDLEALRDETQHGKQEVTMVSARYVPEHLPGETKAEYTKRHFEYHEQNAPMTFTSLHDFCTWIAGCKNTTFVAHNMSGYDGVIVNNYLRYVLGVKTEAVNVGLKVMYCKWKSCRMIDSLNHMASSLDGLPKLMGLEVPGLGKTHFPHKFNNLANRDYRGSLPDPEYYDLPNSRESIDDFNVWYAAEKLKFADKVWDLRLVEMLYCHMDTLVLAMCWGEYVRMMIELTEVNPTNSVTIASTCLKIYRHAHIPLEGITTLSAEESAFAREGLHGGRTEAFARYYKTEPGEVAKLVDAISLYPSVMYNSKMPCGRPKIYKGDAVPADYLRETGFVRVDITPPAFDPERPFFKPVIGGRDAAGSDKYEFNLYPKKGVVITIAEAAKCVEVGYTIDKVHEVHVYEGRDDLFKSYIKTFLKIKVESSKPPADVAECVREYKSRYDIDLDPAKLAEPANEGLRTLAKLALNNLWGKLGQRDQDTSVMVDAAGYHKLVQRHVDGEIQINVFGVDPFLDNTFSVGYRELKHASDIVRLRTNVAIAATVTAEGRLHLYKVLGDPALHGKVLYCDTDSVLFVCAADYKHPLEGNYLGDYEEECSSDEFVCVAPKVYALRNSVTGYNKLRCKGFKATNASKAAINFDSLRAIQAPHDEDDEEQSYITVDYLHFRRQPKGWIYVGEINKALTYNSTMQKSLDRADDSLFIPYGPHVDRPALRPNKRPYHAPAPKLPPVKHTRLGLDSDDDDDDEELTELESEQLMAATIAAQDAGAAAAE